MAAKPQPPRCDDCPLRNRPTVPGHGPEQSDRVIVGEAPGEKEALKGEPFVGKAGGRLNLALSAAQIDRRTVYITNAVLCHPPRNQSPPPPEAVAACRERLLTEVRQNHPRKVLALGGTAAKALTGKSVVIREVRSLELPSHYLDSDTRVRVTYHPSALSRRPEWPGHFDDDVRWLR